MNKVVQRYIPLESRQKIYIILALVSLILLFYGIWQIKPVIVEVDSPLGLASHLTPCYWVGLALLVLNSILAFLDRELKKDAIFILILIVLGLFLFGITVFAQENARNSDVYYPAVLVNNLLVEHHIDINNPNIAFYYSFPALHFISASILTTTGIDIGFVIKYMPLFWIFCFIFITYGIGKRLELAPNHCFLLSFLAVSSWLFQCHYGNNAFGMLLYLLLFMLLLNPRRTVAESGATILIFGGLVITHGLNSLAVLPALLLLSLYRKETRFIALFIVIFGAWYMYQATAVMETGIQGWLASPMLHIFEQAQMETYGLPSAVARAATRYSQLGYVALYAILVAGSFILLLRRRIAGQQRKLVISCFSWAIGAGLLIFSGYGAALFRTYLFLIIPAVGITVLSFSSRKVTTALMVAVMSLTVALSLPANHAGEASWAQVLTTELRGTEFFAVKVKPQPGDEFFYTYCNGRRLILYYDSNLIHVRQRFPGELLQWPEIDLTLLDESHYVIISRQGTDAAVYAWGEDPYAVWPQTEAGNRADLLYNNGLFQIYENHLAE